jgi:hypothetical protein
MEDRPPGFYEGYDDNYFNPKTVYDLKPLLPKGYLFETIGISLEIIAFVVVTVFAGFFWYTGGWSCLALCGFLHFTIFMLVADIVEDVKLYYEKYDLLLSRYKIHKNIWGHLIMDKKYKNLKFSSSSKIKRNTQTTIIKNYLKAMKPFAGNSEVNSSRFFKLMLKYNI